jgi:hypothetical protein
MEKLRFAIQVVAFTLALPVYFLVELSHPIDTKTETVKEAKAVEVNYTKNGRDRTTTTEAVTGKFDAKPVIIHSLINSPCNRHSFTSDSQVAICSSWLFLCD